MVPDLENCDMDDFLMLYAMADNARDLKIEDIEVGVRKAIEDAF